MPVDNLKRRIQMEYKLEEYKARVAKAIEDLGDSANFMAPEVIAECLGVMPYRVKILERLLQINKVETWALCREMAANDYNFDSHLFDSACGVVKDYAETGGANLSGGTGLK